jgi:quercetin dioxygenase-like cupin family protein
MSDPQKARLEAKPETFQFVVKRAEGAEYETDGLREEFVYRDLGTADATQGLVHAHIIKAKHLEGGHNGMHRHIVDVQFAMVLKGWVSFFYEDHGLIRYETGDAVTIPGGTLHELRDYSEDMELLEITMPAVYDTIKADGTTMPTPGQKVRIQERTTHAAE